MSRLTTIAALFALTLSTGAVVAQGMSGSQSMGTRAGQTPSYLAHAGLEQRLGHVLPMDSQWTDETGKSGALSQWFDKKPVVMAEMYFRCAILCPQVLHGMAIALPKTKMSPGKDFDVLVFSIDPMDKPSDAIGEKREFLHQAGWDNDPEAAASVHFLTGPEDSITAVTAGTGFHYVRVQGPDGKMDQFAHSSVILFATPEGKVSKYLAGINYPDRDVRLALLEASQHKISNPVDLLILYCCNYVPSTGRYTVSVERVLGLAGMASIGVLVMMMYLLGKKPKSLRT